MVLSSNFWPRFGHAFVEELKHLLPGANNISEGIAESLDYTARFSVNLFGQLIPVSDAVISMWIAMAVVGVLCVWLGYRPKLNPGKRQTIGELLLEVVDSTAAQAGMSPEQSHKVSPYVLTIFLFITLSNIMSIFGIKPPAQNPGFPVALALLTIFYIIIAGIRIVGGRGFWLSISQPMPALLPFKLLDYVIKPISLAFRLFGNVFGAFILMEFLHLVLPLALPALLGLWFDVADGIIQGLVFSYLTITYIGEIVEGAEAGEHSLAAKIAEKSAGSSQPGTLAAIKSAKEQ